MDITLTRTNLEALKAVAYILDIEEGQTLFHSWRVAAMARILAQKECKESALKLYVAGLLHDVGTFDMSNRMVHHKYHFPSASKPLALLLNVVYPSLSLWPCPHGFFLIFCLSRMPINTTPITHAVAIPIRTINTAIHQNDATMMRIQSCVFPCELYIGTVFR